MDITIALISSITAIIVALIAGYANLKKKHDTLKTENEELSQDKDKLISELSAISILFNHKFLTILEENVSELFDSTKMTRFLILFAVNGKESFRFITACYERNKLPDAKNVIRKYVRMKLDDNYKNTLRNLEKEGELSVNIDDLPNSLLKDMYEYHSLDVHYSMLHFIKRIPINEDNDLLLYASTSTTSKEDFDKFEKFAIRNAVNIIRNEGRNLNISGN